MLKPVFSGAEFLSCICVGFTCRTLVSARLAFEFAKSLYQWQLHPQHLKAIRISAHVQRALLVIELKLN